MQHPEIDRDCLIDRYVRNTLRGAERQVFEEHFLDCPQCLEQLEIASSLREAIRESAAEAITAPPTVAAARPRRWFVWNWVPAGVAACLVLTTVTGIVSFQRMRQAKIELASAQWNFQRELGSVRELASSPEVYVLGQSRGGAEIREIALPARARWMVFSVEMDTTRFPSYRSTLSDRSGKEIWRQDGIQPGSQDFIGVSLPSNVLAPGDYSLAISPAGQIGAQSTITRFPLRFK